MGGNFSKAGRLLWQLIPSGSGQRKSLRLQTPRVPGPALAAQPPWELLYIFSDIFPNSSPHLHFDAVSHSKFLIPLYFYSSLYFQIALDVSLPNFIDLSQDSGFVLIMYSPVLYWINASAYLYEFLSLLSLGFSCGFVASLSPFIFIFSAQ